MNWKFILAGIVFAVLWSSASTATKVGLQSAQPFVISIVRFFIAGLLMLIFAHGIKRYPLPQKKEWPRIMIYGALNVSLYLGLYVIAMQKISAGLGSMAVAINPVIISTISMILFGHTITFKNAVSLVLCFLGILIAAFPLFARSYASIDGILIMFLSMLAYSGGALFYARNSWSNVFIATCSIIL